MKMKSATLNLRDLYPILTNWPGGCRGKLSDSTSGSRVGWPSKALPSFRFWNITR